MICIPTFRYPSAKLKKLLDASELSFRFDAGVCMPSSAVDIQNKGDIVQALLTHYLVHSTKSELDQLKSGISLLHVLSLLQRHPSLLRPLFLANGKPCLSCDMVLKMFHVVWSPSSSNLREVEESVIFGWTEYIRGLKGNPNMYPYV